MPDFDAVKFAEWMMEAYEKSSFKSYARLGEKFGADLSRFDIVPGFYDETLPRQKDDSKIAVAWIDCDLYASTVPVLEYLTPRLADGSVICFDDWFCYNGRPDAGEHLACREWLDKNPQIALRDYQTFHWAGKSFIVNLEK